MKLSNFVEMLDDNPFEEIPVDVKTFVEGHQYLNQLPLSDIQYDLVESMSQIYKMDELIRIMGDTAGRQHHAKYTKSEIIMCLGKGSGKDHSSTIGVAYAVYKLLCLKDPARYYGKPVGDAIDIVNIAINAQQARTVFFKGLKNKIERSPWFQGKYHARMDYIEFDKSITVFSGHSERESHEGLNIFMAILDEISGFGENVSNSELGKTSDNIYKAFRGTVDSRFPDYGKVVLLSFPRYENDYITQKYNKAIVEKDVVHRTHTFTLNPDLPANTEGNQFTIEWDEDHVIHYKTPQIFALKRPTWDVNPTRDIEEFKMAFYTDPIDAKMRFLCQPTVSSDAFFRSKEKILDAMTIRNPVDLKTKRIDESWRHNPEKIYYVHADLAQLHDKCAVAVSHVEKWVSINVTTMFQQVVPVVVVDMVVWWEPHKEGPVNLSDVKHWIQALKRRGMNLGMVTFDRWNCLPETALVYTPNGPVQIKDIQANDEVVTRFGTSLVGNKMNTGVQEVFRITTRLGYEFEATANHKMLTNNGWKTVSNLSLQDKLILNNEFEYKNDDVITPDQAYALGALVADGWVNHKKNQVISFTTADEEFYNRFNECLITGWGFKNKVQRRLQKRTAGSKKDTFTYAYWDTAMIKRMRDAGLTAATAGGKSIPKSVMQSGPQVRAAFLAGYIDGDGGIQSYVDRNGHYRQVLTVDTSSEQLANELVWLSHSLKLEPTMLRQIRGSRTVHRLSFHGKKASRLLKIVNPVINRKSTITATEARGGKERWTFEDGELQVQIRSIESVGMKQTYDISVPEHEEFIANGFVTHNSVDIQTELKNVSINTDTLSVAKPHYEDWAMLLYEDRVTLPHIELLLTEMTELKIVNQKKVDHPRKLSKDLADAVCGSIYNSIKYTPRDLEQTIEVHTYSSMPEEESTVEEKPQLTNDAREYLLSFGLL